MKILFVAFPQSVHTARWIEQLTGRGWDLHLFPSVNDELHADLDEVTTYGVGRFRPRDLPATVRWRQLAPRRGLSRASMFLSRFNPSRGSRASILAQLIRQIRPDIIHSLEFQHAGYLTLEARQEFSDGEFPTWIASNWGSDIYLFSRFDEHIARIRAVLASCDFYHCECERDVGLARSLGFAGQVLAVCPGGGGFDVAAISRLAQPGPASARRVIAVKGFQNWAGRAMVGLKALDMCADMLPGYTVKIYGANPDVEVAGKLLAANTGVRVESTAIGMSRDEVLRIHGSARISIGLSISDAISTSLLEAMSLGSFPIQSDTSCASEWFENGETGFIVPAEDPRLIAEAIRRALADDALVDRAAPRNLQTIRQRADSSVVGPAVAAAYQRVHSPAAPK